MQMTCQYQFGTAKQCFRLQLKEDADLNRVSARAPRVPVLDAQWPTEAVVVRVAKLDPGRQQAAIRAVAMDSRHE